jgi:hypothetical protein
MTKTSDQYMGEALLEVARQRTARAERKRARPLPDQDDAAQSLAIALDDLRPKWKNYERAVALVEVVEHIKPSRRKMLAHAFRKYAQRWIALAEVVEDAP